MEHEQKKRLGKGLDALLKPAEEKNLVLCRLSDITASKDQPRKSFDEEKLKELAQSIKEHGLIQPIVVKREGMKYRIIAGERRFRAAKIAGLKEIKAIIFEGEADYQIALIENLQREDLNPIEVADAYSELIKRYGYTQLELSEKVGKSRPEISNCMRLLTLSEKVKAHIIAGEITVGQARPMIGMPEKEQDALAERIIASDLTARDVEKLTKSKGRTAPQQDKSYAIIESELSEKLAIPVKIQQRTKKIVMSFEFIKIKDFYNFINDIKNKSK